MCITIDHFCMNRNHQSLSFIALHLKPTQSLGDIKELAHRKARIAAWGGLSLMCLLCGMLARFANMSRKKKNIYIYI